MDALGELSFTDQIEAMVKSKIGQFLQAEQTLVGLMQSSSISIAQPAKQLYVEHKALDKELTANLQRLEAMKTSGFTLSNTTGIMVIAEFASAMQGHIDAVVQLQRMAQGYAPQAPWYENPVVPIGLAIATAVAAIWAMRR